MQRITPFLWFDREAEEAAAFYTSLFPGSRILQVTQAPEGTPGPRAPVFTVTFELAGLTFIALNGGPHYRLTEAFSIMVPCDTQEEIDRLWDALSEGGEILQCGWLKDRFGLTWQIVPASLGPMLQDPNPVKAKNVMLAMLPMKKLDVAELRKAYDRE